MKNYQIRFTPYDLAYDLSAFTSMIDGKWVYNSETSKKGVFHFHIHLQTDRTEQTVRQWVKDLLKVPAGRQGIANKYYSLSEWDDNIGYIVKEGYKGAKGYSRKELDDATKKWQAEYRLTPRDEPEPASGEAASTHKSMWPKMRLESEDCPDFKTRSLRGWIVWIQGRALRQGGPLLRNADAYRYAQSLHIIYTTNALQNEEKLERLLNEHADYILATNEKKI